MKLSNPGSSILYKRDYVSDIAHTERTILSQTVNNIHKTEYITKQAYKYQYKDKTPVISQVLKTKTIYYSIQI